MTDINSPIELKGSVFTLLVLYLNSNTVEFIKMALCEKIKELPFFFKHAPIVVNVQKLSSKVNWLKMKNVILSLGFYIIGVSGCTNKLLKNIILQSGLPILSEGKEVINCNIHSIISKKNTKIDKNDFQKTKVINLPIRSGQKIYATNSDLIVTNNINSGAEVVADGNIHIYGEAKGRVLAGAKGDTMCQIFCTKFHAELISIAGEYLLNEHFSSKFIGNSVRIYIYNKRLNIEKLN